MSAFFAQGEGPTARSFKKVPDVGNDKSDPVAFLESREQRVREHYVAIENAKILREELIQCYRKEGVNHIERCQDIAQKYKVALGPAVDAYPHIPALQPAAGGGDDE
eukprot:g4820.t1